MIDLLLAEDAAIWPPDFLQFYALDSRFVRILSFNKGLNNGFYGIFKGSIKMDDYNRMGGGMPFSMTNSRRRLCPSENEEVGGVS